MPFPRFDSPESALQWRFAGESSRAAAIVWVLLLLLTLCFTTRSYGEAQDWVVISDAPKVALSNSFSIYRNHGAPLSLSDAQRLDLQHLFAPLPQSSHLETNFGLTKDEIWMRLDFVTASALPQRWFLEMGHASVDVVDLYIAARGQEFHQQRAGDLVPFRAKPIHHRNNVFELNLKPDTGYRLYLRVASAGTLTVPVTLWQPDALWLHDQNAYAAYSLYYGLLIGLAVYNLFLFFALRDRLYLTYVGLISGIALAQGGLAGLTGQFLWPENVFLTNLSPTGGAALAGIFATLFVQRFLGETIRSLRVRWFMPSLSALFACAVLSAMFWSYHLAAFAVNLLSLCFALVAFTLGAVSLYRREPGARFFVLAWASLLTCVVIVSLHNLGALPSNLFTSNSLLFGSALEGLLLSLALADRIKDIQRAHLAAQTQAIEIRQQMLEAAREHEQRLEQRVAERTLELEHANQRLQESQQLLEQQANHDSLTGLANRKLLTDRLTGARARAKRQHTAFALVVIDLDKFKAINDTLGHAAGDQVLSETARRLSAAVRESDTVARVGGDEFVLILESIGNGNDLARAREKIVNALVAPIELNFGATVSVGASIGTALYPDDADDLEKLFLVADKAMYRNKAAGEKICLL